MHPRLFAFSRPYLNGICNSHTTLRENEPNGKRSPQGSTAPLSCGHRHVQISRANHVPLHSPGGERPNTTAASATQCGSKPVSGPGLPKTGIFRRVDGDFRRSRPESGQIRSPETDSQFAKARHWRAFLRLQGVVSLTAGLPGWGGRIRTSAWWNQNPLPYHLATPQYAVWKAAGLAFPRIPSGNAGL